ncbi:MAG: thrombospondin type 3 repeat-containing protein, partial [Pseudomonadota bacterium]
AINSTFHGNRAAGVAGADVAGALNAISTLIEDPTGVLLQTAMGVQLGDGAGSVATPQGPYPAAELTGVLFNNGGPTRTHAIIPLAGANVTNPLLDAGDVSAAASALASLSPEAVFYLDLLGVGFDPWTDQRGVAPPGDERNDLGAFERVIIVDGDGDSIPDLFDNCRVIANEDQVDADNDGFGNACDPDLNNDNIVNVVDLGLLRTRFFSDDPVADFNVDGVVNVIDLAILRLYFFQPPGP